MFDALVPEYDRFNRLSSLGLDILWRREAVQMLPRGSHVLDVGTGTGDMAKELLLHEATVVGIDFSPKMISAASGKMKGHPGVRFQVAQAENLPFEDESFDGVTSAFVIRNLHHGGVLAPSFREFHRVLKKGGQMIHLELTRPSQGVLSWGHRTYLKVVLPVIGWANFRTRWPGGYLAETIQRFPETRSLCQQIRWAGFERACYYPLSGGIAGLFCGTKC